MPKIRLASEVDADQVQRIYAPFCALDSPVSFEVEPPTVEAMRRRIVKTLERHPWLVCEEGGEILGYVYGRSIAIGRRIAGRPTPRLTSGRSARVRDRPGSLYLAVRIVGASALCERLCRDHDAQPRQRGLAPRDGVRAAGGLP